MNLRNDEKNYAAISGSDTGGVPCDSGNISRDYGIGTGNGELKQCGLR